MENAIYSPMLRLLYVHIVDDRSDNNYGRCD